MDKSQYICLEGLDGTGKSTLAKNIVKELKKRGYSVQLNSPTAPIFDAERDARKDNPPPKVINFLKQLSIVRFFTYVCRSNYAASKTKWNSGIVIGDRSIITSYVCRLNKNKIKNRILICLVNCFECRLKAPDYVIYLDAPYSILLERMRRRYELGELPGKHDDKENSDRMRRWYDFLRENSTYIHRIKQTVWHTVDAGESEDEVFDKVMAIILKIINKE